MILKVISASSVDPDQTALIWVHTVCLHAKIGLKSLEEYSAEDINRRHFQMQILLAFNMVYEMEALQVNIYDKWDDFNFHIPEW